MNQTIKQSNNQTIGRARCPQRAAGLAMIIACFSCAALAQEKSPTIGSPYAPGLVIPASAEGTKATEGTQATGRAVAPRPPLTTGGASVSSVASVSSLRPAPKGPRRALLPHERRRKEGAIPGLVTYPFGKTASGERTHIYRVMGQGGIVADFLDYGARLYRLYLPDQTGALTDVIADTKPSIIDYEKAGDLAPVWQMTPIRKPRATGLVFELGAGKGTKATKGTEATNAAFAVASVSSQSNNPTIQQSNNSRIIYWLDAQNRLTVESTLADTNAASWRATLPLAPLTAGRSLAITAPTNSYTLAATTNVVSIALRPMTNANQKVELWLK